MKPIDKARLAAKCFDDKKAGNIIALEIGELTGIADYFVIGSAGSSAQVKAIADEIEEKMAEAGFKPLHVEGYNSAAWVLLDYGDVVCHVFHSETRGFYGIERLWSDAKKLEGEALLGGEALNKEDGEKSI